MRKINFLITAVLVISLSILCSLNVVVNAQLTAKEQAMVNALETLDNDIVKYFPRWKVCEPNLQIHIYEAFNSAGFDKELLNRSNIEVLAAPGDFDPEYGNYQILLVSCGDASMSPSQLATYFTPKLRKELSGEYSFSGSGSGRTYCFKEIPSEVPVSTYQAEAIISYMQPNDVTHAITLSLFEQNLKVGETGFWLKSFFGNDEAGYPFCSSGQAGVVLQRPLYINKDMGTNRAIPYLMNFYFGGGYRTTMGLNNENTMFNWLPNRVLNGSQSGDFIFGINFHLPVLPQLGVSVHARMPVKSPKTTSVEGWRWGSINIDELIGDSDREIYSEDGKTITHIVPAMHSSGKISLFYNWWLNKRNPENYIRFDVGIGYVETREMAMYKDSDSLIYITTDNIVGLKSYRPTEGLDRLYLKVEYRNQATWPFGVSAQISNQTFLGNIWVPILGNWLLIEMKYSTVLRDVLRPYELKNFLMFSPVIRITI
jgi:hypothetical protein